MQTTQKRAAQTRCSLAAWYLFGPILTLSRSLKTWRGYPALRSQRNHPMSLANQLNIYGSPRKECPERAVFLSSCYEEIEIQRESPKIHCQASGLSALRSKRVNPLGLLCFLRGLLFVSKGKTCPRPEYSPRSGSPGRCLVFRVLFWESL